MMSNFHLAQFTSNRKETTITPTNKKINFYHVDECKNIIIFNFLPFYGLHLPGLFGQIFKFQK